MRRRVLTHAGVVAALCLLLAGIGIARADDVQVTAAVADSEVDVGQPVDFTITVNGATAANVPQNIDVDGLTITYEGESHSINIGAVFGSGSQISRSVTHTYSVVAQRAGDFVIPAQQATVGGKTYTTQPVNLKAGGTASSGNAGGGGAAPDQSNEGGGGRLYYAELVLPKDTGYIGEALPFEVRLFVDARVRANLEENPEITAEGCTVEKTTNRPEQTQVSRNGQDYVMVTYKSAVTPAKTGNLKLGPVTVQAEAELPQRRPRRPQGGPFDDPFFQNPFFDDTFRMMSPPQQIVIKGDPINITALPLPVAGMPQSFAGAVGDYTMTTSVKPEMVEAGDPITVTAKITGRGNFDKVTAPEITDPDGWRVYAPSAKFEPDDDIGIGGVKTFDMAVIPQTKKTASPMLEWSYFDPIKEQYVTLTEKGWPIKVEGDFQAPAAPVVAQQAATQNPQAPAPASNQGKPDIMYIRADSGGWGATFEPLYENRLFWEAQGGPLVALLAFAGVQAARKRAADQEAKRLALLRKEKDAAMTAMQRRDVPEGELYQAAARALRLEAAIQTGRAPDTLDGTEVVKARSLEPAMAERVRRLFDRQDEAVYAGRSGGKSTASAEMRVEVLETVKGYENAKHTA
jgi:hypothetical protein